MGDLKKDEGNGLKNLDKGRMRVLPLFHVKHYREYGGAATPTSVTPTPKGDF